jgi:hypothetical protein
MNDGDGVMGRGSCLLFVVVICCLLFGVGVACMMKLLEACLFVIARSF